MWYPCFALATKGTPVSVADVLATIRRPVTVGFIFGVAMFACRSALSGHGLVILFPASAILGIAVALLLRQVWSGFNTDLDGIFEMLGAIRKR
jgi:hypothetical protein